MNYGNPCIVSKGTNMAEKMTKNKLGWVVNKENLPDVILKSVKEYKNQFVELRVKNNNIIKLNYNWGNIVKKNHLSNILIEEDFYE